MPTCEFFPSYKNSLQGLAGHKIIHILVELNKKSKDKFLNLLGKADKLVRLNNIEVSYHIMYLKKIEFCGTCRTTICCETDCNRPINAVWYDSEYYDRIKISDVLFILKDEEKIKSIYFSVPRPGR